MASHSSSTPLSNSRGNPRRSIFSQRFSTLSIASLPQYSAVDTSPSDEPPNFEASSPPPFFDTSDPADQPEDTSSSVLSVSSAFLLPSPGSQARNRRLYSYINPLYSTILDTTARTPFTQPSKSNPPRPRRHDFEYLFQNRPNKPWFTLQLNTTDSLLGNPHPSQIRPKTPRIWGSEPLDGFIHLDLETAQNIQQINLQIKGKIITSAFEDGAYTFVTHDYPVWKRSMGDPRGLSPSATMNSSKGKSDGKFQGKHTFPFSFPFPTYVDLANKDAIQPEALVFSPSEIPDETGELLSIPPSPLTASGKGKKKRSSWSFFSPRSSSQESNVSGEHKKRLSALPQDLISGSGPSSRQNEATHDIDPATVACPMPQSFVDNGLKVALNYEMSAILVHGRFRPDSKIRTNVTYLPAIEPLPMSVRRQQAYEAGGLLPGPRSDPDGWFALPTGTVHGLFDDVYHPRKIQVECTLYLANPLSYARSTVIPCYMSLKCTDTQALQSLCSPKSPNVRLVRHFRHFTPHGVNGDAALEEYSGYGGGLPSSVDTIPYPILPPQGSAGASSMGGDTRVVLQEVAHAVWWAPPKEVLQDSTSRWLEGEIHLESGLQPSCACPIFSVEYSVEMYPPKSAYFESAIHPSSSGTARAGHAPALCSQPVEITTLYRLEEPVPVAFSEAPRTKIRVLSADGITGQTEE